jgi:hypothetical protein
VIVGAALLRVCRADDDAAVFEFELLDGEVGGSARRTRGFCGGRLAFCGGSAERRIIPLTGGVVKQRDLRAVDGNAGDVEGLRENQRHDFHADFQRFGGEEGRCAEFGIVADGQVLCGERAADQRKAQIAELHFAAERGRGFFFNSGPELIDGNQKWRDQKQDHDHGNDDEDVSQCFIHDGLREGHGA